MNLYGLLDAIIGKVNRSVKVDTQELGETLQKQARDNINAVGKEEVCNPNLLDNWYFGNPVNQNGQSTYTNSVYTIDRWVRGDNIITLEPDGILLTVTSAASVWRQALTKEFLTKFSGQSMTFSVLVGEVSGALYITDGGLWANGHADVFVNPNTVTTYTFQIPTDFEINYPSVGIWGGAGSSGKIIACKLEFGDTQTLAHQDSNGNWILNEVPKYEEELLKCRQYDTQTGEYIGLRKFSQPRNLLDNSDFRNPVNQRGQKSYTDTGTGTYSIDRWKLWNSDSLIVNSSSITVSGSAFHYFERGTLTGIYTLAAKKSDGTLLIYSSDAENYSYMNGLGFGDDGHAIVVSISGGEFVWAALYKGQYTYETLPEYQPKGYAAELAECLRYHREYWDDGIYAYCYSSGYLTGFGFEKPMRVAPTVGSISTLNLTDFSSLSADSSNAHVTTGNGVTYFNVPDTQTGTWYRITRLVLNSDL